MELHVHGTGGTIVYDPGKLNKHPHNYYFMQASVLCIYTSIHQYHLSFFVASRSWYVWYSEVGCVQTKEWGT